jgi:hypothetical protein
MRRNRVRVDCADVTGATFCTVGALARMGLNAQRSGYRVELANTAPRLLELLDLSGLAGVLLAEGQGQTEKRE